MELPQVEPVFLNARDIINFKTVKEHEICEAVTIVIPENKLLATQRIRMVWFICLFGVLRRFQHCTGHITTGSWKGRGNQYI